MYEIEQTHQRYYQELEHNWDEATQIVDGDTGKVLSRSFSFLEFELDYRASLINEAPSPAPYYEDGEVPVTAYFSVLRTVYNTLYQGGEELELAGEGVETAANFRQWKQIKTRFDYQRIWLDQEFNFLSWQPKPPPATDPVSGLPIGEQDPRYELYLGEQLIREADENVLVLTIPRGLWGISSNSSGVYLVDGIEDESTNSPVTSNTQLVNQPYLRLVKPEGSNLTYRISLRGKTSPYLPGTFIPRDYAEEKILDFPYRLPRSQRLVPPGVTLDFDFPEIRRDSPQTINYRDSLTWEAQV